MRAICEACDQVQPPDWQPGDLCGNCAAVVRREQRCHWCVALTPAGKFCRHCGAGQVPDAEYGAARWLKHLGTDQFAIPDRLRGMDPEQVEHFGRLYQRHETVAERHIDDLALAESFLHGRGWTRALEAELLPRLPLPDDELRALTRPPRRGTTPDEQLLDIRTTTPFGRTQALAALARLRRWQADAGPGTLADADNGADADDLTLAQAALQAPDEAARLEAALVLSHWRLSTGPQSPPYQPLIDILEGAAALPLEGVINLALMRSRRTGQPQSLPPAALGAEDEGLAFAAALAQHAPDQLRAALRLPTRRFAAAYLLTALDADADLAEVLPTLGVAECKELFQLLRQQRRPRPELRAFLADAARQPQRYELPVVRELQLLALRPGDAPRLVREADGNWFFVLQVLRAPLLPPEDVEPVCHELVLLDTFSSREVAPLKDIFASGALPLSFVPDHLLAAPAVSFEGLLELADQQLTGQFGPATWGLHTYLRGLVWNESLSAAARTRVHALLGRWYEDFHGHRVKPRFSIAAATAYFGSFEALIADCLLGLERLPVLRALGREREFLAFLSDMAQDYHAADLVAGFATLPPALVSRWRAALVGLIRNPALASWHCEAAQALAQLRRHAPWRESVRTELRGLLGTGDHNLDYYLQAALEEDEVSDAAA